MRLAEDRHLQELAAQERRAAAAAEFFYTEKQKAEREEMIAEIAASVDRINQGGADR